MSRPFAWYSKIFEQVENECIRSVRFLLSRNTLWGDTLDFTNLAPNQPIVFSEWSTVNDSMFKFLVEKTPHFTLFNDEGNLSIT
ncbi:hypothetical protein P1X15_14035 [Runella sp. MFBS21]|uniref:hypothetical protein n=1 Tax=Runella sp. MFBS21 TaxID=3034018 RepID=UPI0023F749B5|nr:hypothetical protein [Runella sp. MFBS21]MDF7818730.1 hypothetical protein [Runella sp. MFBS21]